MKINPLFIIASILVIIIQKLIFSEPVMLVSDTYPGMIFIIPVILLALPLNIDRPVSLILAFFIGIIFDFFADTLGISAFSLVMMTYFRYGIINVLEPRKGYKVEGSIFQYGIAWVILYAAINLLVFTLSYYSIDAFTFVYIKKILINSLLASLLSTPFCVFILAVLKY